MNRIPIFECVPWDDEKDLINAYNSFMELLPDDGWGIFKDADAMWLDPFYGLSITNAIQNNPNTDCFTCKTNRIGNLYQLHSEYGGDDIVKHRSIAEVIKLKNKGKYTDFKYDLKKTSVLSGVLIILSKKAWLKIGGFKEWEENYSKILGVDNKLHQDLNKFGLKTKLINELYIYHWYRGGTNNKSHLK